jgi:CRISPR/Cas system endoribonuclease Cas6 (RAMP superfamily)
VAESGTSLTFELNLVGLAADYLPYFLVTFRELGQQGIGIGRGRYAISRVLLSKDDAETVIEVYSGKDNLVRPSPDRLTYEDCRRLAARLTPDASRLTIRFLTPTHLKANGTVITRPDFHHLIKRLRDRINALAHFYCQDALDVDYKAFGERAEAVRTVRCQVRWEDRDRRSWKTGLTHDMGGFIGEVTYEGELAEFLPLLILGQYTHVGKYAVWGNGWYEIKAL